MTGVNKPLPIAFILFIAGIVFARFVTVPFLPILLLCLILCILFLFLRKKAKSAFYILCACLIFILGILSFINFNYLPPSHIAHLLKEPQEGVYMQGEIVSSPDSFWMRYNRRRVSFLLKTLSYKKSGSWIKAEGTSKVIIKKSQKFYSYGDKVVIFGKIKKPARAANPGGFDYARFLKIQNIYTIIDIKSDDDIAIIAGHKPFSIRRYIFRIRDNIEGLIKRYLPAEDAGILNAMLIGKRSRIPKDIKEDFIKTGTAHILSVSGLHVAVISGIIFFILRFLRIPGKLSSLILTGLLIIYALLAGARTPIIRASIMIIIYLFGHILERDFDIYSALSLAGIIILMVNPMQVFNAGFALSFACVFSICYLAPRLYKLIGLKGRFLNYILRIVLVSVAVYIGIMPITAYYFNMISPVTVLANLLIVPLLGFALSLGILFIIAGFMSGFLAAYLGLGLHILLSFFIKVTAFLSHLPLAYFYVPDIPLYVIALYYILLILIIKRRSLGLNGGKVFIAALLAINVFAWRPCLARHEELKINFLDTNNAVCAFLEFPNNRTMLVCSGSLKGHRYNQADSIIRPFIWSRGRGRVDALFLMGLDPSQAKEELAAFNGIEVAHVVNIELDHRGKACLEGFGEIKILITGPSEVKAAFRDIDLVFSPKGVHLYAKEQPEIAILRGEKGLNKAGDLKVFCTKASGALAVITNGVDYSVKRLSDTR